MFECEQCGGTGFIPYVALYMGSEISDSRACDCVNRFLKEASPVEILSYIKNKISKSAAQRCPF